MLENLLNTDLNKNSILCKIKKKHAVITFYRKSSTTGNTIDGGISGGTMVRPALQDMMNEVKLGNIQTVLVYKVDRLSRSIIDFHNMMKEFDKFGCNLVSITQSFDTSTSMGKLTLNMLLSFAQFERELSAERVRDKIHASRAKGMWTGGIPSLGYDIVNKKLAVNEPEATQVIEIFTKYMELKSLNLLHYWTIKNNIRNKKWTTAQGRILGGSVFCVHSLNTLLRNPLYIGKIRGSGDIVYDAQHDAIIDVELFKAVQTILTSNNRRNTNKCVYGQYLLNRKIKDLAGNIFKNQSSVKNSNKWYRYYRIKGLYLPANEIENVANEVIQTFLNSNLSEIMPADIEQRFKQIDFEHMTYEMKTKLLSKIIDKIVYGNNHLTFYIYIKIVSSEFISKDFINNRNEQIDKKAYLSSDERFMIIEREIILNNYVSTNKYKTHGRNILNLDENKSELVRALAFAWRYRKMYEEGDSIDKIRTLEKTAKRTVYKYMNLAYLSPIIIESIIDRKVPDKIDLQTLFKISSSETNFDKQEKLFIRT